MSSAARPAGPLRRCVLCPWQNRPKMVSRSPRSKAKSAPAPAGGQPRHGNPPTAGKRVANVPQPMPWEKLPDPAPLPPWEQQAPRSGPRMPWEHQPVKARRSTSAARAARPAGTTAGPGPGKPAPQPPPAAAALQEMAASPLADRPRHTAFATRPGWHAGSASERDAGQRPPWQSRQPGGGQRDRESRQALAHLQQRGSPLWETWQRLAALSRDLQTILPNIRLQPLRLEKQTLVVTAASSAMAARLRQYEPRLLEGLQARGWLVSRIRFKPTTLHTPPAPAPRQKAAVPPRALASIEALASAPDTAPGLRAALQAFVKRQRTYWE